MIQLLLTHSVIFLLTDFFPPALTFDQEQWQLNSISRALLVADQVPDGIGLINNKIVCVTYRCVSDAQEVRDTLLAMQLLMERDGDPWWVRAARGEAANEPGDDDNGPEFEKGT